MGQSDLNTEWVGNCFGMDLAKDMGKAPVTCAGTTYGSGEVSQSARHCPGSPWPRAGSLTVWRRLNPLHPSGRLGALVTRQGSSRAACRSGEAAQERCRAATPSPCVESLYAHGQA